MPRLTEGNSLAQQPQRPRSAGRCRKFTVLAAGTALCLAATGALAARLWTAAPASAVRATDVRSLHPAAAPTRTIAPETPQQIAQGMLAQYGWESGQFPCLDALWTHESGWNVYAENPASGAYGIPQALPGSQMASAGADWQTSAATQIRWGLTYIKGRYGSPCAAWSHEEATGWYQVRGLLEADRRGCRHPA
jgi:hypothetical protein